VPDEPPEAELLFIAGATGDVLERMIELFARHGDVYRTYVPAQRSYTYVVHHPDDVKHVLVSNHENYTKGFERDRIKVLLGLGLMTSEGDLWTRQRRMMQPLFHRRVVEKFAQVIREENDRLIARWENQAAQGQRVNITEAMSELTLRIILRCIFGRDMDALSERFAVVTREPARNLDFVYKFRALGKSVADLIGARREHPAECFDYLSLLLSARDKESGEAMSERQLIDEILTLVVAGHETTASVLNWTWYLLSQHPDTEAHLHADVAARDAESVGFAPLESLVYTRQVLDEVMRLYPPGWLLSRRTIGPDILGGFEVPGGADVLVPLYLVHRDPRFWAEPDAFRPERFAPGLEAGRPRFAYVPFAAGPRHCIGETLALYEMLMHLQHVVPRYRMSYVPDRPIALEAQINLRTRHPMYVQLQRR
jgi:cytochrome P450